MGKKFSKTETPGDFPPKIQDRQQEKEIGLKLQKNSKNCDF